jgi:hypothetical protein
MTWRQRLARAFPVGTRSVLFGVHQFVLHPVTLAAAWWLLYGEDPVTEASGLEVSLGDPRLWVAFLVHDLGYIGKPNMDGPEGETHPVLGARIMGALFGQQWHDFVLLHSRFYSKNLRRPYSRLCAADKVLIAITPVELYVVMARLSGEINEYREGRRGRTCVRVTSRGWRHDDEESDQSWYRRVRAYCWRWAKTHSDGREDNWTPATSPVDVEAQSA